MRQVTAEEARAKRVPIGDVVLPLIGEEVAAPAGPVGAAVKRLMERLDVDLSKPIQKVSRRNSFRRVGLSYRL